MSLTKFKDSDLKALIAQVEAELPELLRKSEEDLRKAAEESSSPEESSAKKAEYSEESSSEESSSPEASAHKAEESSMGSSPEESSDKGAPSGSSASPAESSGPPPDMSASAPAGPSDASASAPPAPDGADGQDPAAQAAAGEGPVDPMALEAEYDGLPDDELMVHYQAAKNAVFKRQQQAAPPAGSPPPGASPPPGGPPAGPPAMKAENYCDVIGGDIPKGGPGTDHLITSSIPKGGPKTDHQITSDYDASSKVAKPGADGKLKHGNTGKAEMKMGDGSGGQMKRGTMKSETEAELEALKKSQADMEQNVGRLAELLMATMNRPQRLAVTSITAVPKPGDQVVSAHKVDPSTLSKTEIRTRLSEAAKRPDLKKSDREAINEWTCNTDLGTDKIAHLLQ